MVCKSKNGHESRGSLGFTLLEPVFVLVFPRHMQSENSSSNDQLDLLASILASSSTSTSKKGN
jgi:hypothetical protein